MKRSIFFLIFVFLILLSCSLNTKDKSNIEDWFFDFTLNDTINYNFTDSLTIHYEDDTMEVESDYIKEHKIIFIIDSINNSLDSTSIAIKSYTDSEYDSLFYIIKNNSTLYFSHNNIQKTFLIIPVIEGVSWNSYGFFLNEYSFTIEKIDTLLNIDNKWYDDCLIITGRNNDNDSLFCQYIYSPKNGFLQIKYNYIEKYMDSLGGIYIKYHKCKLEKQEAQ